MGRRRERFETKLQCEEEDEEEEESNENDGNNDENDNDDDDNDNEKEILARNVYCLNGVQQGKEKLQQEDDHPHNHRHHHHSGTDTTTTSTMMTTTMTTTGTRTSSSTTTRTTTRALLLLFLSRITTDLGVLDFTTATTTMMESILQQIWQWYARLARQNRSKLLLLDAILERYLWWVVPATTTTHRSRVVPATTTTTIAAQQQQPTTTSTKQTSYHSFSNGRSMVWAALQLNRLAMDLALRTTEQDKEEENKIEEDGTTLPLGTGTEATNNATSSKKWTFCLRLALTVIQSLWPLCNVSNLFFFAEETTTAQAAGGGDQQDWLDQAMLLQTARSHLFLERLRLLLRSTLLVRYWMRCYSQWQSPHPPPATVVGLLRAGGTLLPPPESFPPPTATVEQQHQRMIQQQARINYIGKRTGKRLVVNTAATASLLLQQQQQPMGKRIGRRSSSSSSTTATQQQPQQLPHPMLLRSSLWLLLGEVLYLVRPWFWAEAEVWGRSRSSCTAAAATASTSYWLWKAWLASLGMDVASLYCTSSHAATATTTTVRTTTTTTIPNRNDPCTVQEWKRRRMRLALYLLRSPLWEQWSLYFVNRTSQGLESTIPLLGSLLSLYLQDWIYFWKEYRLEEG